MTEIMKYIKMNSSNVKCPMLGFAPYPFNVHKDETLFGTEINSSVQC